MEVHKYSEDKTAFVTHCALYRHKSMRFRFENVGETFHRALYDILTPVRWQYDQVYSEDVEMFSQTPPQHIEQIDTVWNESWHYPWAGKSSLYANSTEDFGNRNETNKVVKKTTKTVHVFQTVDKLTEITFFRQIL